LKKMQRIDRDTDRCAGGGRGLRESVGPLRAKIRRLGGHGETPRCVEPSCGRQALYEGSPFDPFLSLRVSIRVGC
jgi:hypothetical protein